MRLRFAMEFILADIQLWIESQMLMNPQIKRRKMQTVKEIDKNIKTSRDQLICLYDQINKIEENMACLKAERKIANKKEQELFIDNWLCEHFGISNQKEARQKSIFIIFDKAANFIKSVSIGIGEEFRYIGPVEDKSTLEYWLKKNKLYAHRASSFCDRDRSWYDLSLKDQLKNLSWKFDSNGKLKKTQW